MNLPILNPFLASSDFNKANASDTEAAFLDLHLSISNGIVSTKIYDKRDDFDFEIVNFPFLDGDVPRSTSYGVYISQLIRFARASSYSRTSVARTRRDRRCEFDPSMCSKDTYLCVATVYVRLFIVSFRTIKEKKSLFLIIYLQ